MNHNYIQNFPGPHTLISTTNLIFQDFPSPGNYRKINRGHSRRHGNADYCIGLYGLVASNKYEVRNVTDIRDGSISIYFRSIDASLMDIPCKCWQSRLSSSALLPQSLLPSQTSDNNIHCWPAPVQSNCLWGSQPLAVKRAHTHEITVWFSLTKTKTKMVKNEKITNSLTKTKTKTKKWWKLKRN